MAKIWRRDNSGPGAGRRRALLLAGALLLALPARPGGAAEERPPLSPLVLKQGDRILVLAPHPDDEVLGCGGILQEAAERKLPARVVFLTNGDNNELSFLLYRKHPVLMPKAVRGMGEMRRQEALKAARALGLPADRLTFLGYPDWGTLHIWQAHWGNRRPPYRSMLTRARAVPYPGARRPGAPYKGEEILADLEGILREFKPTKVFVSHPADSHPDHRALYLFTRVALWDLEGQIRRPKLYPYLVHYRGWPRRVKNPLRETLAPPASLTHLSWSSSALTSAQVLGKLAALRAHRSQYRSGPRSMLSFVRLNELFGDYHPLLLRGSPAGSGFATTPAHPPPALERLAEKERAAFVGVEWQAARLEGSDLVLTLDFSKPLAEEVSVSFNILGYRAGIPFEQMPKLLIRIGPFRHRVYDQARLLPAETVSVTRKPRQITVRVPLEALGGPDRILSSARTTLADVPLDWVSWRVLELGGK